MRRGRSRPVAATLALSLSLALVLTVAAQPLPLIARIGPSSAAVHGPCVAAFTAGMRELGLVEGRHYRHEVRYAEGQYERFPALTDELLRLEPAVIMVATIASARAALQATTTVPIVFVGVNDPVGSALVASLARPGGNATGLSNQSEDLLAKYVELLREVLPLAKRVAVLLNPANASNPGMAAQVRAVAAGLGIATQTFTASSPDDLDATLAAIAAAHPDALLMIRDAVFSGQRDRIAAWSLKQRLPTFAGQSELVQAGVLLAYAAPLAQACRRSAVYVKKILAGVKPAELPVEQPTRFELVINLKTARALGITIPPSVLLRADEVMQ